MPNIINWALLHKRAQKCQKKEQVVIDALIIDVLVIEERIQWMWLAIEELAAKEGKMNVGQKKTDAHRKIGFNSKPFPSLLKNYSKKIELGQ